MQKALTIITPIVLALSVMLGIASPVSGQACECSGVRIIPPISQSKAVTDAAYVNEDGVGDSLTGTHDHTSAILTAAAATADTHVVTRVFGDGRWAQLSGATFTGAVLFPDGSSGAAAIGFATKSGTGLILTKGRIGLIIQGTGIVLTVDEVDFIYDGNATFGSGASNTADFDVGTLTFSSNLNSIDAALDIIFNTPFGIFRTTGPTEIENTLEAQGNTDLGDAVGDVLTIRAGTVTHPNATTVNIDNTYVFDATGQSPQMKGITWDFTAVTNLPIPDANAATEAMNQQTSDARYVQTRSPIVVMFGGGTDEPNFNTTNAAYTTAGIFLFGGTTALGTPTAFKVVGFKDPGPTSWDFRVLDITNATTIVTKTGNTGTAPEIVDAGALSNLPAAQAIFEIQIQRAGGLPADFAHIHSLNIEF